MCNLRIIDLKLAQEIKDSKDLNRIEIVNNFIENYLATKIIPPLPSKKRNWVANRFERDE